LVSAGSPTSFFGLGITLMVSVPRLSSALTTIDSVAVVASA
jgi:hypothetical protein